uniref:GON-Abd-1 n=1 Tax=Abdopus aculeatus TaxID=515833 RepID=R4G2C1_ABDAC
MVAIANVLMLGTLYSFLANPVQCFTPSDVQSHFVKIRNTILVLSTKAMWGDENVAPEDCAAKCWSDKRCLSFEITKNKGRCFLSKENAATFREVRRAKGRDYYQRVKPNEKLIIFKKGSIQGFDNLGHYKNVSLKKCKQNCRKHPECNSFEYKEETKLCDLSNVTHLTNEIKSNRWGWDIYIFNPGYRKIDCGTPKDLARALKVYSSTTYESEVTYICPMGEKLTSTCEMNNEWTSVESTCKEPVSCKDIKMCGRDATDGEYWIYPSPLSHKRLKVYCHDMETDKPKEFITLPHENFAFAPALKPSYLCMTRFDEEISKPGKTIFKKVRIYPEEMVLDRFDFTFTELEKGKGKHKRGFGAAEDCLYGKSSYCKSKGEMKVDLTHTGLIIGDSVKWVTYGDDSRISDLTYSENKKVVTATCGGKCGGCKPEGKFTVQLSSDEPSSSGVKTCEFLRQKHCSKSAQAQ